MSKKLMNKNEPNDELNQSPKRYSLYAQLNINEKYLDYFIIGAISLLFVVMCLAIM